MYPEPLPVIFIARRPRGGDGDWQRARSWLGGLPRLGSQTWPRSPKGGEPMYFMAQIDLADVARQTGPANLPSSGSLAFFISRHGECAVIEVRESSTPRPTAQPADAPVAYRPGMYGHEMPDNATADEPSPRTFPYWPIDLTRISVPPRPPGIYDDDDDAADAARAAAVAEVQGIAPLRQYDLGPSTMARVLGDDRPLPLWWHTAQTYVLLLKVALQNAPRLISARQPNLDAARKALQKASGGTLGAFSRAIGTRNEAYDKAAQDVARIEKLIAAVETATPRFRRYVEEAEQFVAGKSSWDEMRPHDIEAATRLFARAQDEFEEFVRYYASYDWRELSSDTTKAMVAADDAVYAKVPEPVRSLIDSDFRSSCGVWHQMFGEPLSIQDSAASAYDDGNILLLQLVHDDMMHWRSGDNGATYFFISPADLARRNWTGVKVMFECH